MDPLSQFAKSIPVRKSDVTIVKQKHRGIKYVPIDLDRRYDEAVFRVYQNAIRRGHSIPRASASGELKCIDTPLLGFILGFAYGLQYDWRQQGACYTVISDSLLALFGIYELLHLIFIPWEWARLNVASQNFIEVGSTLYAKCEV